MRKNHNTNHQTSVTRFALGQTFITPGAEEALQIAGQTANEFLRRHMSCDWGDFRGRRSRERLAAGFPTVEQHRTGKGQQLWIITEADRSSTDATPFGILNRQQTSAARVRAARV